MQLAYFTDVVVVCFCVGDFGPDITHLSLYRPVICMCAKLCVVESCIVPVKQ